MSLKEQTLAVLGSGGCLQQSDGAYRVRPGQIQLAEAVAEVVTHGGVLAAEAGTGVGKTYGYLVPLLLSGKRALISTATRNLQDQLSTRDIPELLGVLGVAPRVVQLKGRGSYLCLHRLAQARHAGHYLPLGEVQRLAAVERWALHTRSGDMAELPDVDESSAVMRLVTSTRENCLGGQCPSVGKCHVNLARQQALRADVVVVNHHLFFADLQLRDAALVELLPQVDVVVFDEAHRLNDIGIQFSARQWSTGQVRALAAAWLEEGTHHARGLQPWAELVSQLEHACAGLDEAVANALSSQRGAGRRLGWQEDQPDQMSTGVWHRILRVLIDALTGGCRALEMSGAASLELRRLGERTRELVALVAMFADNPPDQGVRWLEQGRFTRMIEAPLTAGPALSAVMQPPEGQEARRRSWVFTSATLGVDDALSWFTRACGLPDGSRVLKVPSPFDYTEQSALYVPPTLPDPSDSEHLPALVRCVAPAIRCLKGRTLVLSTSLRALELLAQGLRAHLVGSGIEVRMQGEGSRRALLDWFRQAAGAVQARVLVASGAFWEGVDVPGEALQMVVMDKLPFPSPDDPLAAARGRQLSRAGQSPFRHLSLPAAAMALRQGAGRLIRTVNDRGVLVVGDRRLLTRSYGAQLLAALPAMPLLMDQAAFMAAIGRLTKASTTDRHSP